MSDRCPPILGQWEDRLVAQQARARSVVEGLAPERLVAPPEEGKWSVAHCLDHLATTIEAYRPYLEGAIERGAASRPATPPDYRPGRFARWFIRVASPGGRAVPAPKLFRPAEEAPLDALDRFLTAQQALLAALAGADGIDVNRWKLRSPASALLRFRVGEALELMVVHNDRHLDQAERARATVTASDRE